MSYMTAQPDLMGAAAANVAGIQSAIAAANAAAAGPTTSLLAAAADEVSAATATLFGGYGQEYQAVIKQAAAFHDQFAQALAAAGLAYVETDIANAWIAITSPIQSLLGGGATPAVARAAATVSNLILGASGYPIPSQEYIDGIPPLYSIPTGLNIGIFTPEGLYPLTGVKSLTFDVSAAQGLTILNNAINSAIASGSNSINVFGYSQSAVISSMEMAALNPTNTPGGSLLPPGTSLSFTLVGDPSNPNGGLLSRFPGLRLPSLGLDVFGIATPDNSFPTRIFTIEYDGFGDFPRYPINALADVNAFLGIIELHGQYPFLTPDQLLPTSMGGTAVELTNTLGPTQSQYFIVPTEHLPILSPLRATPFIGNPLADLLEPDFRVLVDLGYGSTTQGWSPDPPNVPTAFGVIPPVSPSEVLGALGAGTQQGISAFASDLNAMASPPPNLSLSGLTSTLGLVGTSGSNILPTLTSTLSSPANFIGALQSANTYVANGITVSTSAAYATLLPTADVANAIVTSVPSYDINLFLNGVEQIIDGDPVGGLVNAFGAPIAADTALVTLFGGFEARVFEHAASQIVTAWSGTPPAPPGAFGPD
jgi:hypothetical protein